MNSRKDIEIINKTLKYVNDKIKNIEDIIYDINRDIKTVSEIIGNIDKNNGNNKINNIVQKIKDFSFCDPVVEFTKDGIIINDNFTIGSTIFEKEGTSVINEQYEEIEELMKGTEFSIDYGLSRINYGDYFVKIKLNGYFDLFKDAPGVFDYYYKKELEWVMTYYNNNNYKYKNKINEKIKLYEEFVNLKINGVSDDDIYDMGSYLLYLFDIENDVITFIKTLRSNSKIKYF